jgi:hypothetical protein
MTVLQPSGQIQYDSHFFLTISQLTDDAEKSALEA